MLYCHVGPWLSEFSDVVHTNKVALGSVSLAVLYRHALFHAFFLGYVHGCNTPLNRKARPAHFNNNNNINNNNNNNNVHLSCAHQRPERSHDTY